MSFNLKADIERLIGKTYAGRGAAYAKDGRVIKISGAQGKKRLSARVRGSGRSIYSQTIVLKWSDYGRLVNIEGDCSCPIEYNCKHVAAVLFVAEPLLRNGNAPLRPANLVPPVSKPARQKLSGPLQLWLETRPKPQESGNGNEYPPRVLDRIYYVLNRDHANLVVQPHKVRLKKDGTVGKNASRYDFANVNSPTPPKFVRPIDFRIRRYLSLAEWSAGFHLGTNLPEGEEGRKTLELLLQTGRARWRDVSGIALVAGAERKGRFVWRQDKSGTQTLEVKTSKDKSVIALPVDPLWYLDPESGECGLLFTDQPPERAFWLAAAPPVNARETERFVQALGQLKELDQLKQPDQPKEADQLKEAGPPKMAALPLPRQIAQVRLTDILPTPILRLHAVTVQKFNSDEWRYYPRPALSPKEIVPALSCVFDYNGARVCPNDKGKTIEAFDGDRIEVIVRHTSHEARHLVDLENIANVHGFEDSDLLADDVQVERFQDKWNRLSGSEARQNKDLEPCFDSVKTGLALDGKTEPDFLLFPFDLDGIGPQQALEFLRFGVRKLRDLGWRIEIGKDWPCPMHEGDHRIFAGVKEDGNGWFSLALNIEVAGQEIDLLAVVLRFLNQMPPEVLEPDFDLVAYLADQTFYLRLADGRYLSLPAAPLAPALKAFLALHGQMHPGEAVVVADIAEALAGSDIAFTGGEKLLELGRRLRALASPNAAPLLPVGFMGELRPYQKTGLGWLTALAQTGFGGVLADDMGLGKTVQALAFLAGQKETAPAERPNLLIVPTSLVGTWQSEAARFTPDLRVLVLHGLERKTLFDRIADHDLVITTYPLLHRDADILFAQNYDTVILDEAQMVKNPASRAAKLIRNIKARQRLALSGTPMENNLEELWSLYDWLIPGLLGNRKAFQQNFRKPIEKKGDRAAQVHLSRRIAPFLLRRTKEQVALDLPPKTVIAETITLSGAQRELYETIRIAMDQRVRLALEQKGLAGSRITVLDALLKLRQVCCDPALVKLPAARAVTASAKRARLLEMLDELMSEGRRVLVFSQFVEMLRLIEKDIKSRGYDYAWLSGETKNRGQLVERFQGGDVPIFLISLKAGGLGLTLTAADTVILYDPWWNPAVERQAMDRTHRIGQDRPVFVHRLITRGTVETRIEAIQKRKQQLADALFDPAKSGPAVLSEDEILSLFQPIA
ncbi:COG0553: Superfamily II DNA/RNA helicases, SNF2 family [hydrothermal vent metagenome]|uniref:COG0553: Superfamily II DNA/RNA helicases, SNF2 family n=1 Tax=hydrothermal vent metagenome TaxID=652676 RepID=A0A3B0TUL4_9ZZZZ